MQSLADSGRTVNGVWYPPEGYTNRSDGSEWVDRSYQCTIRKFKSGGFEVCSKLVGGIKYKSFAESAAMGGLVSFKDKPADTRTSEQVEEDQATADRENKLRAIRRARQGVRFAVKAIAADHLLTLTYREDMQDVEKLKRDWKEFNRLMRKGLKSSQKHKAHAGIPEWKFVCIRERQDRGAYHLHIAVVGRQDIGFIRRCWYEAIGGTQDDYGDAVKGQIDVVGPKKRWGTKQEHYSPDKLAGYLCKYLEKTIDEVQEQKGAKRYWVGRANDKPEITKIWLGAQCFYDAIKESHRIFRDCTQRSGIILWASQGYESIWLSG